MVESNFCTLKTGFLDIRPIFVRTEEHVRGHVFLCMLALKVVLTINKKLVGLNLPLEYIFEIMDEIQYTEHIFPGYSIKVIPAILTEEQRAIINTLKLTFPQSV